MSTKNNIEILKKLNIEISIAIDLYKKGELTEEEFVKISLEIDNEKNKLLIDDNKNDLKEKLYRYLK